VSNEERERVKLKREGLEKGNLASWRVEIRVWALRASLKLDDIADRIRNLFVRNHNTPRNLQRPQPCLAGNLALLNHGWIRSP